MSSVPRPLVAVLAVVVLFFVLWTVALKHTLTGSGSGSSQSPGTYQSAINQARGVQSVVNSASARAGGTPTQSVGRSPAGQPSSSKPPAPAQHPSPTRPAAGASAGSSAAATTGASLAASPGPRSAPAPPRPSRPTGMVLVDQALRDHKVLALLVYNPAAADDRAVRSELGAIPTHGGKVVKLTVPVQQLGTFSDLLNAVSINFSPTLVLIDRARHAEEIVGFADSFEIAQRVAAALRTAAPAH